MTRAKIIDYYLEKSLDENFEIDQVRKDLEAANVDEEEIQIIVRLVDNEIQKRVLTKSSDSGFLQLIYIGAVLAIFGAGFTIASYLGLINTGNGFLLVYGPFFGGISILLAGLAGRRKHG